MKERPILMSAPMVRAILDKRKTQTRRVVKPQPPDGFTWINEPHPPGTFGARGPYGIVGDRLWLRHAADLFPVYFKPIQGWEGVYAAGTDGAIYRMDRGEPEVLSGSPTSKGYLTVSLSRGGEWETHAVHKLVCRAFYGPTPLDGAQVRHMDGERTNNRPGNLDWGTQADNWQDRKAHGRGMGESHHAAKITEADAAEIRAATLSQRELARQYGVTQSTIHKVRAGKSWGAHDPGARNAPAWKPWSASIFMPRWASRITLEVTDVRVERVQEISEADVHAEGTHPLQFARGILRDDWSPQQAYSRLWDSLNAKRGFGWDTNPWVWCISFKRIVA